MRTVTIFAMKERPRSSTSSGVIPSADSLPAASVACENNDLNSLRSAAQAATTTALHSSFIISEFTASQSSSTATGPTPCPVVPAALTTGTATTSSKTTALSISLVQYSACGTEDIGSSSWQLHERNTATNISMNTCSSMLSGGGCRSKSYSDCNCAAH